jgi:hypothetical protein
MPSQARLELGFGDAGDGRESGDGEALTEYRRVRDDLALIGRETIKAARDECCERLGHGELGQIADRPIRPILEAQPAIGDEHPDGLNSVQGDAAGPADDRANRRRGQSRHKPDQELAHRGFG